MATSLNRMFALTSVLLCWFLCTTTQFGMATAASSGSKPWADSPMKLIQSPLFLTKKVNCLQVMILTSLTLQTDLFTAGASHMCNLHNSILRGYNSIYHQAPHVQPADKADFVGYALAWHKFVKSHHDDEEETLFTKIEALLKDDKIFAGTHAEHGRR